MEYQPGKCPYVKYFFLPEVRAFYAALGELSRHAGRLREIYPVIGELDALQAIASYRESLPGYVEPAPGQLSFAGKPGGNILRRRHE